MRSSAGLAAALALALALAGAAEAKVFASQEEALALAFPEADRVEKRVVLLDPSQTAEVARLAGAELPSKLVKLYTGWKGGAVLGYALIDVHTVRTQPEALLVVLTPEGRVRSLRMLAFHEPSEYLPGERWLGQFEGRRPGEPLRLGGEIHGIAGATLSSQSVTSSVRRALALYQVLVGRDAPAAVAP